MKNEKLKENENLEQMAKNSLKNYKNDVLIKEIHEVYNDILHTFSKDKLDSIEIATKSIVDKEDILEDIDLVLNYLGLENLIRSFADLQNIIYQRLRKKGIHEQMLCDIVHFLTGEDICMSLAMKNELNNAFYKLRLLSNNDMQMLQKDQTPNNLYRISLN